MGSYQRQHSRSTAGIEPISGNRKKAKKERAGKRLERERDGKKRYLWTMDQILKWAF